jgi:hypothetical protein
VYLLIYPSTVPVYQQYLVFKGKKLEDDTILSSLQYVEGANVIYLLVKNERALLKLIIFLPGEKKKKLKKEVESFYSVPVYQQYLVFKGKKLEDDMILSSLQYVEGANVIYLLVKNERALLT